MIYLDTSSLLKLFHDEPESAAVGERVAAETEVIVSPLARLEARIQIKSAWLAGIYGRARYEAFIEKLERLENQSPFIFKELSGTIFSLAARQDHKAGRTHLRVLDRLHLAAMEELAVNRLMTNDTGQAAAAKALGYQVIVPR